MASRNEKLQSTNQKVIKGKQGETSQASQAQEEKFVFFYGKNSPFSQHFAVDFEIDGITYNCAEQYMMHQKAGILFLGLLYHAKWKREQTETII